MANVRKRLRRLELHMTDASGFVPHSRQWLEHWRGILTRLLGGDTSPALPRIPIAAFRALVLGDAGGGKRAGQVERPDRPRRPPG